MKSGDLVTLSAKSLRIKSGGWPTVRDSYKVGLVLETASFAHRNPIEARQFITVLWNNGYQRVMPREELKHAGKNNESR